MFGGELIATGSDSCVFIPNLPCKGSDKIDDNRVSKIIYSEGAEEDSLEEKKMNEAIQKIKGYSSWAIIFDQFCKPLPKHVLMDYDEEGLNDCIGDDSYLQDDFDKHSYMMNGIYGGETMDDYFYRSFESKKMSLQEINKAFLQFMKMMEPLFLGLKKMGDQYFVMEMIQTFIESAENSIHEMKKYFEAKDWKNLSNEAHKIVAPARHLEATEIVSILKDIENKANQSDPQIQPDKITLAEQKLKELIHKLKKHIKSVSV